MLTTYRLIEIHHGTIEQPNCSIISPQYGKKNSNILLQDNLNYQNLFFGLWLITIYQ